MRSTVRSLNREGVCLAQNDENKCNFIVFLLQVIFSMADEYVPEYVDKKALVGR